MLFRSNRDGPYNVFRKSADGGSDSERLQESDNTNWPVAVTPDGITLLFAELDPMTGGDLWTVPLDGSAEPTPLLNDPSTTWAGELSPDGRWMLYVSDKSGQSEVHVTDFPGVQYDVQVSTAGGTEPVWSPRGNEIFYRERDGIMISV